MLNQNTENPQTSKIQEKPLKKNLSRIQIELKIDYTKLPSEHNGFADLYKQYKNIKNYTYGFRPYQLIFDNISGRPPQK